MSFNSIIKRKNELDKRSIIEFLKFNEQRFLSTGTSREQSIFESDVINYKERVAELKNSLNKKSVFKENILEDFQEDELLISMNQAELITAEELYVENRLKYENALAFEKQKLISKLNEIKAKLNILKSNNSKYSFVHKESFINFYNINNHTSSNELLNIDTESEVTTLPEIERNKVQVNSIYIGASSNGTPGNEDGKFKNIFNILTDNKSRFEYFKYGERNLKLEINLRLRDLDVVNEIVIEKTEISSSSSLVVKNIIFELEDSSSISIKRLVNTNFQKFEIDSIESSMLKIKLLPIKCKAVSFLIESKEYSIKGDRKHYSIGLRRINLNKVRYSTRGQITSLPVAFPKKMETLETKCFSWPNIREINFKGSISTSNYSQSNPMVIKEGVIENNLLGGSRDFAFEAIMDKKNVELKTLQAYKNKENFFSGQYTTKIFNKDLTPNVFSLPKDSENINILQYGLCRRASSEEEKIKLGFVNKAGVSKLILPLNLSTTFNEIKVFLSNKIVSTQVYSLDEVVSEDTFFLEDSKYLYVYSNEAILKEVGYLLETKEALLIKEQEGFYIKINETFDFSKNNIKLFSVEKNLEKEIQLEKNVTKFSIEENISSFELLEKENDNWIEADNSEYTLNLNTGILSIDADLADVEKRLIYKYENKMRITEFDIWKKDKKINGLFINEKDLNIEEIRSTINVTNNNFFALGKRNIIKNSIAFEENFFNEFSFEEVEYINGKEEFKNIKKINRDLIPSFEVAGGSVSFFSLYDVYKTEGFGNRIKIYNEKDEVINNLTINSNGNSISISGIQVGKIENWYMEYYTLSTEELGFRYSVNYELGIIHYSSVKSIIDKEVFFQSGNVVVEYDICNKLENFSYDPTTGLLQLYLEEALDFNSKIKILWEEETALKNLNELKVFYSPLLYELQFGAN